jgi:hypothetical protein
MNGLNDEVHQLLSDVKNRANKVYWSYVSNKNKNLWHNITQKFMKIYNNYSIYQVIIFLQNIYIKHTIAIKQIKSLPHAQISNTPHTAQTETVPEKKKETVPEKKKETVPEKKKETVPEKKKETVPEKKKDTIQTLKKPVFKKKITHLNQYKEWKKNELGLDISKAIPTNEIQDYMDEDEFENNKNNYNSSKPWFEYIENNMNVT